MKFFIISSCLFVILMAASTRGSVFGNSFTYDKIEARACSLEPSSTTCNSECGVGDDCAAACSDSSSDGKCLQFNGFFAKTCCNADCYAAKDKKCGSNQKCPAGTCMGKCCQKCDANHPCTNEDCGPCSGGQFCTCKLDGNCECGFSRHCGLYATGQLCPDGSCTNCPNGNCICTSGTCICDCTNCEYSEGKCGQTDCPNSNQCGCISSAGCLCGSCIDGPCFSDPFNNRCGSNNCATGTTTCICDATKGCICGPCEGGACPAAPEGTDKTCGSNNCPGSSTCACDLTNGCICGPCDNTKCPPPDATSGKCPSSPNPCLPGSKTCVCDNANGCVCGPCDSTKCPPPVNGKCPASDANCGGSAECVCKNEKCDCGPCNPTKCNAFCTGGKCSTTDNTCVCPTTPTPCPTCKTDITWNINTCGGTNPKPAPCSGGA